MSRPAASTKARPQSARVSGVRRQPPTGATGATGATGQASKKSSASSAGSVKERSSAVVSQAMRTAPSGAAAEQGKRETVTPKANTAKAASRPPTKTSSKPPKKGNSGELLAALAKLPIRWLAFGAVLVALIAGSFALYRAFGPNAGSGSTSGGSSSISALQGDDLGGTPAPNFTLTDQNGNPVTLSSLRGHLIALTFFDSLCPHTDCSLMAQYVMASANLMTPQERAQVTWLAISLNPWHDTPATAKTFLSSHNVTIPMRYLLGTLGQVAPVWSDYHMESILQSNGIVIHTTGLYIIDQQGLERVFLEEGFDPHMLAGDLHLLLTKHIPISARATAQSDNSVSLTQSTNTGTLTLRAIPGQYGTYDFELWVWDANQQPVQAAQATLDLTMTDMVMQPVHVVFQPDADLGSGVYQAHGVVSMAGHAKVVVNVQPLSGSPIQATFYFTAKY